MVKGSHTRLDAEDGIMSAIKTITAAGVLTLGLILVAGVRAIEIDDTSRSAPTSQQAQLETTLTLTLLAQNSD